MRLAIISFISFAMLGACGGGGGGGGDNPDGSTNDDGSIGDDAAVDAPNVPVTITISGTATSQSVQGAAPVPDATIEAFDRSDEATPVATTTTNAQGNFTLEITTTGVALDGFLRASKMNFKDTFLYPPAPIAADTEGVPVIMVTPATFGALSQLAGVQQQAGNGLVALVVADGASSTATPIADATVTSAPAGTIRYNGANSLPSAQATSTAADGIAYVFNAPAGPMTINAAKTGSTFKPTAIKAHADQLTTTVVVQQQ
jgi:hypothetical protein